MAVTATQKVADELREEITSGMYDDGQRIGRRQDLADRFKVSEITIRRALELLTQQGLVTTRHGENGGVMARVRERIARITHERYTRTPGGANTKRPSGPTDFDQAASGHSPGVNTYTARRVVLPDPIAERLNLPQGSEGVRIDYVFYNATRTEILQASTSWEIPDVIGTEAEVTEEGDRLYGRDVISRMDLIGLHVDQAVEETTAIAASGDQAKLLGVEPGAPLLFIERIHFADGKPVETTDILLPGNLHKRTDYITVLEPEEVESADAPA